LILVLCTLLNVAFFTLIERKILGYIQVRKGPNKAGFKGVLQPFRDAVKLFTKELNRPSVSNHFLFLISPVISLRVILFLWLRLPTLWGVFEISLRRVFLLCCIRLSVYPVFISGWASNSKYSLLGGLRAIAQTISYEVRLSFILLRFIIMVGGLSLALFFSTRGGLLILVSPILGLIWTLTCLAETGRSPFDLPEGESELVSGFNTEYRRGSFALFFLGEYGSILFLRFITCRLILSSNYPTVTEPIRCLLVIFIFVWARGTLPRYRYDRLISLTWKVFLPVSLVLFTFFLALTV